ncbi:hypothetical protein QW131_04470 [Roseibium salinum]|nr:hypothetical protein [Roseibium salinum]
MWRGEARVVPEGAAGELGFGMAENTHELAPEHLPAFLPSMEGSDPLMMIMLAVLIIGVVLLGTFYLHLHSLPERLAHKHGRMHF